ncbi:sensor histidine kinase [Pelagicoccus albus]|uniref:Sensor histidine kinase n=1 Tax=Pelagicoccus albus TaxID=415222 RepID=A0A7X1B7V2_9BACT|nr:sensor histidine kinase [Pelagicoccus albus]MBC2607289.1 sensor histidine kinase [Pelagicoccus albus]
MVRFHPTAYTPLTHSSPYRLVVILLVAHSLLAGYFSPSLSAEEDPNLITTAAQARALTPEEAAEERPILLRGCFMGSGAFSFSFQDETGPLFIFTEPHLSEGFEIGDLVEVVGVTNPGDYAPCAYARSIKKIGTVEVPKPIKTTIAELSYGQMDAYWVQVEGIVRNMEIVPDILVPGPDQPEPDPENMHTKLKLADGNSTSVVEVTSILDPALYIDAKIRVTGHCFYLHNGNRQFVRPNIHTLHDEVPEIIEPPLHRDFEGETRPVSSLSTFDHTGGNPGRRVHVRGVVTHQREGIAVWIRDRGQSLQIQAPQTESLSPGDVIDVLGFPEPGTYSPVLEDAEFKKTSQTTPPEPVPLQDLRMIIRHDSDLVQLEAELTEIQRYAESVELTLEALGTTVRASLLSSSDFDSLADWRPGSIVRASGIATVGEGETKPLNGIWFSESLHLLLRSPEDLAIITPAPWWNAQRISYALGAVLVLALIMIAGIVWFSKRRFREQQLQRAMAESEFSAILSERNRVAREIHDTLAQNIGAISVHLELVRTDSKNLSEPTQNHIQTAHKLARTALADARESIWNMRSQVLEKYDLGGALKRIATQLTENTGIDTLVEIKGDRRRLPPIVENNLLRIGQEAVTNACKHAEPTRISVRLVYSERKVELSISDNGKGFRTDAVPSGAKRSFGLVGIQERIELLGGEIEIKSEVGKGTEIKATAQD